MQGYINLQKPKNIDPLLNSRVVLFFFFWAVLHDPIVCSLLVCGIPAQNSGYKVTRLFPSSMLSCHFVPPPSFPALRHFQGHSLLLSYRLLSVRFCRLVTYLPIPLNPTSAIASSNEGYSQLPPPPSPWMPPGEPSREPVLKNTQGPLHPGGQCPRLRPKQQHRLSRRLEKMPRHLWIRPLQAQNL